ncbi:CYTH and CHAD domain-containing protein [Blastococcus sp. PRF04-17]|uniref:CYTH and CHAD domain-containing protein n=1 Tax=Blastococcus sp. PRF04-17 TaxID=2933797 RepID=UPI001FF5794A|nr:CYTH and CHAD domain-containing protein [Blastococcus sp. PRF04-17]UOY00510.1 CYTH and CHAD domain-containing protein [Blastococcus sp. PRF04-17]
MATGQLEIERKFDVDEPFALPSFDHLPEVAAVDPPVEHDLEATYHDTVDLRLLRGRVTLRRRTGGTDAGWHLKLPAGSARRELHAPLGRAVKNPPKGFLAPVAGLLRGEKTVRVASLRTRRVVTVLRDAAGRVLAEVADDTVTATAFGAGTDRPAGVQAWREVEVELVSGDEDLLAAVAQCLEDAGARPSASASKAGRVLAARLPDEAPPGTAKKGKKGGPTAGAFVVGALREQVAALQQADILLRTEQPDAVHQMRIAARRLRSSLAAFRDVLDRDATRPIREELAWLGAELSGARDDEVALAHLRELLAAEPPELVPGPVAARIQQADLQAMRAGLDAALATVEDHRYVALLDSLHDLLGDPPLTVRGTDAAGPVLRKAVRRTVRRLRRHLESAERASDDDRLEALHAVRKAAKRVRYAAEAGGAGLEAVAPLLRPAKRMQKLLGALQDTVVTREQCRRLGLAAFAARENAFAYGRLHALEQARAEAAERRFWEKEPRLRKALERASG